MSDKTRRKFLFAGISLAAIVSFFKWGSKPEKKEPTKFLTKEGTLVQVDLDKLPVAKRNASKEDVQNWIKK